MARSSVVVAATVAEVVATHVTDSPQQTLGRALAACAVLSETAYARAFLTVAEGVPELVGTRDSPERSRRLPGDREVPPAEAALEPVMECLAAEEAIVIDHLAEDVRWEAFAQSAASTGMRSAAFLPLWRGERCGGVFELASERRGGLPQTTVQAAASLVDVVGSILSARDLAMASDQRVSQLQTALESRTILEQAKGMLAAQLGTDPEAAFVRLRAYARSERLSLKSVAEDVVAGSIDLRDLGSSSAERRGGRPVGG